MLCPACSEKLAGRSGVRGAFLRAWLWGGVVALLGTLVWYAIAALANMELGIVAIGVGYAVGVAVRRGSYGRGGWKYQLLAMFLTYASIVTSYVPFVVQGIRAAANKEDAAKHEKATGKKDDGTPETAAGARAEASAKAAKARSEASLGKFALAWLIVFGIAFAAPFFGGTSGIMGLIIIGIALYEAWKLNRRVPVTGPFRLGAALAVPDAPVAAP